MKGFLRSLRMRLGALIRRRRLDRDLQDELAYHLEMRRANMTRDTPFGNATRIRETTRDLWSFRWLEDLARDLRFAIRHLMRRPLFATVAVVTLALAIGASTVVFSLVNAVLLRPLPYRDSHELVRMYGALRNQFGQASVSPADFLDYREQSRTFSGIAAAFTGLIPMTVTGVEQPFRVQAALVSGNYFDVFGEAAMSGRTFNIGDEPASAPSVGLISSRLWQRLYGGDDSVVGEQLGLTGAFVTGPVTIVGVMPDRFNTPYDPDLWLPLPFGSSDLRARGAHFLAPVGRLVPETPLTAAREEMDTIAARLEQEYPETNTGWSLRLAPLRDTVVGRAGDRLLVLSAAVALLLLIACANVANLLLASGSARARELATRAALGAGGRRLVRLLISEAVVLCVLGGSAGVLLAFWTTKFLSGTAIQGIPRLSELDMDLRVLMFSAALSAATLVAVGLAPAFRAARFASVEELRSGANSEGRSTARTSKALVAAEIAVCMTLLVGAGLVVRSFVNLVRVDPGFNPSSRLVLEIVPPPSLAPEARQSYFQEMVDRVDGLPGVAGSGLISELPLSGRLNDWFVHPEGEPPQSTAEQVTADYRRVDHRYFDAMEIPIRRGRALTFDDVSRRRPVAVVDEVLENEFFPDGAIGRRVVVGGAEIGQIYEIVGVAGAVLGRSLDGRPYRTIYIPDIATPDQMALVIRPRGTAGSVAASVRAAILDLDPDQPVAELDVYDALMARDINAEQFETLLIAVFASSGLLLAGVGLYGVVAFSTARRTREIGVRIALGSRPGAILRLVMLESLRMVAVGAVMGLFGAHALSGLLEGALFGVSATDPVSVASAAGILVLVSLVAVYVPARRAAGADPMVSLRHD